MESYFLDPNDDATISLYNGTFESSENIIARDRISDASIVGQNQRTAIDPNQWIDKDTTVTQLTFTVGSSGTYVAGVSTKPRTIELTAEKFNDYLQHDGVLDMLEQRTNDSLLDMDAVESYQKHVKAIYQVGETRTNDWNSILGYPIEFVPLSNPYDSYSGEELDVQLLLDGQPLGNQLIYADYKETYHSHSYDEHEHGHKHEDGHKHGDGEHDHEHEDGDGEHDYEHEDGHKHDHEHGGNKHSHEHKHGDGEHDHEHEDGHKHDHDHGGNKHSHEHKHGDGEHDHEHEDGHKHGHNHKHKDKHNHKASQELRTNDQGIVSIKLPADGIYYLRTIHMVNAENNDELTHESKWATLTFEVTHKHDENEHTHHHHDHDDEIPTWWFMLGSLLIVGLLFFVFRKKN